MPSTVFLGNQGGHGHTEARNYIDFWPIYTQKLYSLRRPTHRADTADKHLDILKNF